MKRIFPALLAAACLLPGGSLHAANPPPSADAQAVPPADARAAGRYRLSGSPDVVAMLELRPDGRFRYMLIAGAVDARSEGLWTSDGLSVTLTTSPRPVPPEFSAGPVTRAEGPLSILVVTPGGRGLPGIDLRLGYPDGQVVDSYTQEDGWRPAEGDPAGTPAWVEVSFAMYDVPPRRFALDAAAGNAFVFVLTPNDIQVLDFRDWVLDISGDDLVARPEGYGAGTFRRVE